jgi:hypothetical protein
MEGTNRGRLAGPDIVVSMSTVRRKAFLHVFSLLIIRLLFPVVPARSTRTSLTDENKLHGKKSKRPLGWRTVISSGICLKGLIRRVRIL